ncbi:ankyrin repeat-containing domain protein [Baffinella frigidus]|nr:ankyrin repeat-containing domain protein [Cryptophyta sp. CCMP2293]
MSASRPPMPPPTYAEAQGDAFEEALSGSAWTLREVLQNKSRFVQLVPGFLDSSFHIHLFDSRRYTALHAAMMSTGPEYEAVGKIHLLLKYGADVNAVSTGVHGTTALHKACESGLVECARTLLLHGANANSMDNHDTTPMYYAIFGDIHAPRVEANHPDTTTRLKLVKMLVRHNASLTTPLISTPHTTERGCALHHACRAWNRSIDEFLIMAGWEQAERDTGANHVGYYINYTDIDNKTPLHYAAKGPNLLETGAVWVQTAIDHHKMIVDELIYLGADVFVKDRDGRTAAHIAHYFQPVICKAIEEEQRMLVAQAQRQYMHTRHIGGATHPPQPSESVIDLRLRQINGI